MSNVNELIGQVRSDMDVYGSDGKKIGSVGEVNIGTHVGETHGQSVTEERSFFQVKRGFLGTGNDLYIPADQIQEVSDDRVVLASASDAVEAWSTRPTTPEPGGTDDADLGAAGVALGTTARGPATGVGTKLGPSSG